jgi:succinyl-CoA synthetase beta subunit
MRFYEFEAKALLARCGIPASKGGTATTPDEAARIAAEVAGDVVLKSQVLSGGRMKAGGVQFASTPDEARRHAEHILQLEIGGHRPRNVLVEAKAPVKQEYYAGITWDAVAKLPVAIFSDMGGIDIEQVAEEHPDHVGRIHFSTFQPLQEFKFKELVASVGVRGNELNQLSRIMARLARGFLTYGLTLFEINPLAQLEDGSFIALDSHVDMEEEARDQQKALLDELGIAAEESTRRTTAAWPAASSSSTATSAASSAPAVAA